MIFCLPALLPGMRRVIETIHHCHLRATKMSFCIWWHTLASKVEFLSFSSLPLLPSHLPPPPLLLGLRRIINAVLVSTIQLAWVFISSCHILAASIISHCKAIWVLITGRVHRQGDPSTCHMYSAHANAGTAMSLPHRVMRWYSRKDTVVTHLQQRRAQ